MKIRKSKYHQKSVKVVHCGALIWRKFSTNCDAHLAESLFQIRSNGLQLFFAASFLLPYTFFPELEVPVLLLQSF